MALIDNKIPIITGRNDVPTTSTVDVEHPNGSFFTAKYNNLIDELSLLNIKEQISVTGNGTYDPITGIINITNANLTIDHIRLNDNTAVGRFKQYIIYADPAESLELARFVITDGSDGLDGSNGINGVDGIGIDHIALTNTVGLIKTYTVYGDVGETIVLGSFFVTDGARGDNGLQGIQGIQGIQGQKGDKGDKGDTGATGSLGVANSYTFTANNVSSNANVTGLLNMPTSYAIYKITSNAPCRVRIYLNDSYRQADINRASEIDITGDHGCYVDAITSVDKGLVRHLAPPPIGLGDYITVTNLSPSTVSLLSVTITALTLEA